MERGGKAQAHTYTHNPTRDSVYPSPISKCNIRVHVHTRTHTHTHAHTHTHLALGDGLYGGVHDHARYAGLDEEVEGLVQALLRPRRDRAAPRLGLATRRSDSE